MMTDGVKIVLEPRGDCPGGLAIRGWDANHLGWVLALPGGEVWRSGEGMCAPSPELVEAVRAAAARPLPAWVAEPIFIRFGSLPKGGRSTNHLNGLLEAGISAYPAEYDPATGTIGYAPACPMISWDLIGRPAYLITGREVGVGADGEPVLADVEIIGRLRWGNGAFTLSRNAR